MKNIKCQLSYKGTRYFGFQKTDMGPSIEEELENALAILLRHRVKLQAASRTDRGVPAKGQVVNFFTERILDLESMRRSLCGLLPKDVVVNGLEIATPSFHPSPFARVYSCPKRGAPFLYRGDR